MWGFELNYLLVTIVVGVGVPIVAILIARHLERTKSKLG